MKQRVGIIKPEMYMRSCRMCTVCRAPFPEVLSFFTVSPRTA